MMLHLRPAGRFRYSVVACPPKKHEAAKAAFDALDGKAIPKVAQLSEEYAALLAEKKERYEEYKKARKEMIDFQTAKQNVDRILGTLPEQEKQKEQER